MERQSDGEQQKCEEPLPNVPGQDQDDESPQGVPVGQNQEQVEVIPHSEQQEEIQPLQTDQEPEVVEGVPQALLGGPNVEMEEQPEVPLLLQVEKEVEDQDGVPSDSQESSEPEVEVPSESPESLEQDGETEVRAPLVSPGSSGTEVEVSSESPQSLEPEGETEVRGPLVSPGSSGTEVEVPSESPESSEPEGETEARAPVVSPGSSKPEVEVPSESPESSEAEVDVPWDSPSSSEPEGETQARAPLVSPENTELEGDIQVEVPPFSQKSVESEVEAQEGVSSTLQGGPEVVVDPAEIQQGEETPASSIQLMRFNETNVQQEQIPLIDEDIVEENVVYYNIGPMASENLPPSGKADVRREASKLLRPSGQAEGDDLGTDVDGDLVTDVDATDSEKNLEPEVCQPLLPPEAQRPDENVNDIIDGPAEVAPNAALPHNEGHRNGSCRDGEADAESKKRELDETYPGEMRLFVMLVYTWILFLIFLGNTLNAISFMCGWRRLKEQNMTDEDFNVTTPMTTFIYNATSTILL